MASWNQNLALHGLIVVDADGAHVSVSVRAPSFNVLVRRTWQSSRRNVNFSIKHSAQVAWLRSQQNESCFAACAYSAVT